MQEKENIEELFKEAFKNYEEPVKPELWTKVSNAIQTPPATIDVSSGVSQSISTGTTGLFGNLTAYITGAIIVAGTVAGIYIYSSDNKDINLISTDTPTENIVISDQNEDFNNTIDESSAEYTTTIDDNKTAASAISEAKPTSKENTIATQKSENTNIQDDKVVTNTPSSTSTNSSTPINTGNDQHSTTNNHPTPVVNSHIVENKPVNNQGSSNNNPTVSEPNLNIVIDASTKSGTAPLTVDFASSLSYEKSEWNFGDGSTTGFDQRAQHTFENPGDYIVKFKTTTPEGKQLSKSVIIEVLSNLNIANVPNVFTPNGDGKNDLFTFSAPHLIDFEVEILDQSGRKIHTWRKVDGGWDGRLNSGQEAREGTYFYIIFATGENNRHNTQQGTLKLMR